MAIHQFLSLTARESGIAIEDVSLLIGLLYLIDRTAILVHALKPPSDPSDNYIPQAQNTIFR